MVAATATAIPAAASTPTIPTATTTTSAPTTAAAAGAFFARTRDVDCEGSPSQFLAMQCVNGLLRLFWRAHSNETKPPRTAGCPVHHQNGFEDRAVRRKSVLQVVFSDVEGKIPHKQFCTHVMSNLDCCLRITFTF
jgi:hypothetical protein